MSDQEPTTTHASWGAGNPRLLVTRADERATYEIDSDLVRVGSGHECDLVLEGAASVHAIIEHTDDDECVLTMHAPGQTNASTEVAESAPGKGRETLRTGAHFTAGDWRLVFQRDEFADHGRPYGGREGGEGSDQTV